MVSALLVPFGAALARELDVRAEPVPRLVLLARALRPELGVALAQAWLRGGRVRDGLRLLEDMCRRDRDNPWLWMINGYSLRDHGGADASITAFRRPIDLDPTSFWAHYSLAIALFHSGKLDQALAEEFGVTLAAAARQPAPSWRCHSSVA